MKKSITKKDWLDLDTSKQFDRGFVFSNSSRRLSKREVPASNSLFIESLILQLCRLLENDKSKQKQLYNAICAKLCDLKIIDESYRKEEFASLRGHYWEALATFIRKPDIRFPLVETSRYSAEYEEINWIASGGFGKVYRAKHHLDQVEYAVKKIEVKNKDAAKFLRTLAEVKTLARLNHSNIVQYKAAWLEACVLPAQLEITSGSSSDLSDIVFEHSDESGTESSEDNQEKAVSLYQRELAYVNQVGAILYVTMELCHETLREWLNRRNEKNIPVDLTLALSMMRQIAEGMSYIHQQNVVHHDIKPSNIFVNENLLVQVGDFGLACTSLKRGSCPLLSGHRGTSLYAAPEQLRGKCHQRSDLFSLALVFIELLMAFGTNMERVAVLNQVRERKLPLDVPSQLQGILMDMLESDPNKRPKASKLVDLLSNCYDSTPDDKDRIILELRRLLAEKDMEINRLQEEAKKIRL